jgi:Tol biopolymer transport system component
MIPVIAAIAAIACDGGSPAGPGEIPTPVASVVVAPDTATLSVGETRSLQAKVYAADGRMLSGRGGAWSSNDATVVTVDATGKATARAAGLAIVTAQVEGRVGKATLRVPTPVVPVAAVQVGPAPALEIQIGETTQLVARTYAADGSELDGRTVTWTSDRADVASVGTNGLVSGLTEGVARITATSEGKSAHAQVTVKAPVRGPAVASVEVRPSVVVTYAGVEAPLAATLKAADGSVLSGREIAWTIDDASVATVSAAGVVKGLREGEAMVTASVEGRSATVAVSFKTASSYHLAYDRSGPAFFWMDMRTGSAKKMLEHGSGIRSTDPSPSQKRSGFAYVYDVGGGAPPQIAIQSWDGATYRFLTAGDQPAWSPDGTYIAFRSTRAGRADIWSMRADGSASAVNLTADMPLGVESEGPAWSPTGDRIVFAASNARGGKDLWIMSGDGRVKNSLTQGPSQDTEPTWLGDRIVFTRRTQAGPSELYWIYVNGALAQRLTAVAGAQTPAWAPDGRWIAFVVRDGDTGPGDIYVVRPDGTDVRPLSLRSDGPTGGGSNPAWTLHW